MKVNDDFIRETVNNVCALVPISSEYKNGIYKLNDSAELIFNLLEKGLTRDEIVEKLSSEYDSDASQVAAYTDEFIEKLRKEKILIDD